MRNITVSLDDETYRAARVRAAELGTSVSALVKQSLLELATGESETAKLKRAEKVLRGTIESCRAGDRLSREDVHDRSKP